MPTSSKADGPDRRRLGRLNDVNTRLVPLMRGDEVVGNVAAQASSSSRKACAACREHRAIPPLTMAFQPIIDLREQRIDAYEALVRGASGESAAEMLKWATGDNLYAFDQACRVKAIELAAHLGIDRNLNVNFLPNAVYEPRACIRATLDTAARTGFNTRLLTFEIVETEWITDSLHLLNIISEYRKMGFRVALDDFGTGYSGLARLAELRPDVIKVDRGLIQDCDQNQVRLAIVASITKLATDIGVKVVVEGVERLGELEALQSVGIRFMQGYYFAKPAFEKLVVEADIDWFKAANVTAD